MPTALKLDSAEWKKIAIQFLLILGKEVIEKIANSLKESAKRRKKSIRLQSKKPTRFKYRIPRNQ
jgi:hypothetical protein